MSPYDSDKQPIVIKHFSDSIDSFGQRHTTYTTSDSMMALYNCRNTLFDDPRFNHVELIGLTDDSNISDDDHIVYKDKEYKVIYSLMSKEYDSRLNNCYWLEIYE